MHNLNNSLSAQANIATMAFSAETTRKFQSAYDNAVAQKQTQFEFAGHPFLTQYAKYLLEYLRGAYGL